MRMCLRSCPFHISIRSLERRIQRRTNWSFSLTGSKLLFHLLKLCICPPANKDWHFVPLVQSKTVMNLTKLKLFLLSTKLTSPVNFQSTILLKKIRFKGMNWPKTLPIRQNWSKWGTSERWILSSLNSKHKSGSTPSTEDFNSGSQWKEG